MTVKAGDILQIRPAHVMTHDNTWAVMAKFASLSDDGDKRIKVADPHQPVLALDHNVQDRSARNLERYAAIEAFAVQQGIDFYPAGRGIGHQVIMGNFEKEGAVQCIKWCVILTNHRGRMCLTYFTYQSI